MRTEMADVPSAVVRLMREEEPDLDGRLAAQEEALNETACTDPVIGRWVMVDVKHLISALDLEDEDFAVRFPSMARVTREERQRLISIIEDHCDSCAHCGLKRGYDIELDGRIKKTCQENNAFLLSLLEEGDDDISEEDHLANAANA